LLSLDLSNTPVVSSELVVTDRAMATRVTFKVPSNLQNPGSTDELDSALAAAKRVFHEVDETCTRFEQTSPLMQLNRSPQRWHKVPATLFRAIEEAKRAYDVTQGRFDPRVLSRLIALGYDRTLPFGHEEVELDGSTRPSERRGLEPWRPRLRYGPHEVLVGDDPIDLGGIGKGLAVRWSSQAINTALPNFLVEAGGDCYCAGLAEDGGPWRIGVEDPSDKSEPICVLGLRDRAVATSSIRLRHWARNGKRVHHLIDPRTGEPGGQGLTR
jgi:thiamine biosynthesis lipoprotein